MPIADDWRKKLAQRNTPKQAKSAEQHEAESQIWAAQIIARIPAAIETAVRDGVSQIRIGRFRIGDVPPAGLRGEFCPTREVLKGGALMLFDFCQKEGLSLFVGDFERFNDDTSPYQIIIRLEL